MLDWMGVVVMVVFSVVAVEESSEVSEVIRVVEVGCVEGQGVIGGDLGVALSAVA